MSEPTLRASATARRRRVGAGVGLAVLLLGSAGGASAMISASNGSTTCAKPANIDVSVVPEMYDTVFNAAQHLSQQGYVCATYNITSADSLDVANHIQAGSNVPDVWIPDSSMWVQQVTQKLGQGWLEVGGTLATSPVGIAFPKSIAGDRAQVGPTWASAYTGIKRLTLQDPGQSGTSYVTLAAANSVPLDHTARTALLQSVVALTRSTMDPATLQLKATLPADQARDTPMSEQQMIAFDQANPTHPLTAAVPAQGAGELDYPFVMPVQSSGGNSAATAALYAALSGPSGRAQLTRAGFRVAGGGAPAGSPMPATFTQLAAPDATQTDTTVRAWQDLAKDARMLVLIDVSGSMATEIAPGESRIQLLAQTCIAALNVLPPTTEIGAWVFSTNLRGEGNDYLPISDGIQSIDHTAAGDKFKASLVQAAKTIPVAMVRRNGDTALYKSVLAAYEYSTKTFDPNYVNSVVVLTDGKDDVPHGTTISLASLLSQLKGLYNPDKPVKIVTIGIGGDTDVSALSAIATATNGLSYQTSKADDIASVFVDAFLHRG